MIGLQKIMNSSSSTELISRIESSLQRSISSTTPLVLNPQALSQLIDHSKQLLETIQILRLERKSYTTILENSKSIQIKLNNHNSTIQSIENTFNERLKVLNDENKALKDQLEKQKKYYQEKYQNIDKEIEGLKEHNQSLESVIGGLRTDIDLLKEINLKSQETILEKQRMMQTMTKISTFSDLGDPQDKSLQSLFASRINTTLIKYLSPKDIKEVLLTSRMVRQSILNTNSTTYQIFRIINRTNRRKNKFLERHVRYFDISCEKISQDVIQTAFYKYMILKKNVGAYMLNILTDSALLFEGKFVENLEELPVIDSNLEELGEYEDFPVDRDVKEMYKEEQVLENKMISDQVYTLYQKILNAAQLYSADVESSGIFLSNLQNNYSKLFVFSKKLFTEAKHLQMLNNYLIKMLVDRQHFQITKNSEIEDIKAQLQSQSKIKNFFSVKSINSQQRCLSLQNQKLNLQMRLKDLSQRYYDLEQSKKKWEEDNKDLGQKNQILIKDNKLFKQNFDQVHLKYTKIMQELEVLRNNLQKMNLSEH